MDILPSHTVYVNNLADKIHKDEMRRTLYSLFGQYGVVLDVVVMKGVRMRGQAHVVFRDVPSATSAVRSLPGFMLYNKPVRVSFAKAKSHATMRQEGSFGKQKGAKAAAAAGGAASLAARKQAVAAGELPPNKVLYVTNLPKETTEDMVRMLFGQYDGMKEIRLVPNRPDLAFVEYETEAQSAAARTALQGFRVAPELELAISFAKK